MGELAASPVIDIYILTSLWVSIKVILSDWNIKEFSVNFNDCWRNKQIWRTFTAPFFHSSVLHTLLNVSTLWSIRFFEKVYGSLYILKYSVVLVIFETCFVLVAVYFTSKLWRNDLNNVNTIYFGSTGILIGWLGFLSIDLQIRSQYTEAYLLGLIPIPLLFAPLVLLLLSQFILPKFQSISQTGSLIAGYLLATGILNIIPNAYLTFCFFMDLLIIIYYYYSINSLQSVSNEDLTTNVNENALIEVMSYDTNEASTASNSDSHNDGYNMVTV